MFVARRGFVIATLLVVATLVAATTVEAAVVRDVRADADASTTRIVIEIDGDFRYRTKAGPHKHSVLVDIEAASLAADVPRLLPVSDARVDGVLAQEAEGGVRLTVDIAGRKGPGLVTAIEGSRLVLTFRDAGAARSPSEDAAAAEPPPAPSPRAKISSRAAPSLRAATAPATAGPPSLRRSVAERAVVILDPGHGGKDPGAQAWTGEYEKDIVLDLAERVARRLRKGGDIDVVMTRSGDSYVPLADRRDASRRWGADVFVSLHANASPKSGVRGIETYYRSRSDGSSMETSGDRDTRRLARLENGGKQGRGRSSAKAGVRDTSASAAPPLLERRAESLKLARLVQGELVQRLGMRYETVHDLGVKEGPFFVLGENAAPSVLVEAAFLTHREEGLRMRSEVYREQIADGVARGIQAFLEEQRRLGAL
ncbi:MAG: N-acetylmuramoyl-L-alanine amidase [Candidatus Binatia bacterium]